MPFYIGSFLYCHVISLFLYQKYFRKSDWMKNGFLKLQIL